MLDRRHIFYRIGLLFAGLFLLVTPSRGEASDLATSSIVWTNSLGMKFRNIPDSHSRMSVWETRVSDFASFVDAKGYDATQRFFYYAGTSWHMGTNYWRYPGFEQTGNHPVVGVSWNDAVAFCEWLTMTERGKGSISDHEAYRLPTEREWSIAAQGTINPMTMMDPANVHYVLNIDPFPFTSPVGSFSENPRGFYDMAGNAWEYCLDLYKERQPYRVIRGGSWQNWHARYVGVQARGQSGTDVRITLYGFRVVLADDDTTTQDMRDGAVKGEERF
jgi:formylglycine-generating enzyme required for sulfatase activity